MVSLAFQTTPPGAEIFIDSADTLKITPVTFDIAEFNNQMVQMGWAGPAIAAAGIFIALMQGRKKAA